MCVCVCVCGRERAEQGLLTCKRLDQIERALDFDHYIPAMWSEDPDGRNYVVRHRSRTRPLV